MIMENTWKEILWRQFGAAIDMFGNALRACPDELWSIQMWNDPELGPEFSQFWYVAYHALFWLDLYLSGAVEGFNPPAPFTLAELDPAGLLPERIYTRDELLVYLAHCRLKCQTTIHELTDVKAGQLSSFPWGQISFAELLLDNMRHVQEHGAQLNLILGQNTLPSTRWVARTKE
jgi:DinB superfamily